ncbi:hypothetical protein N658DRAFT_550633, partial [Parathielavia hyrcaniae]
MTGPSTPEFPPAVTQQRWSDAPATSCLKGLRRECRGPAVLAPPMRRQLWSREPSPLQQKKVKTIRRRLPSFELLFPSPHPTKPNLQTTKSHYHTQRFSTAPNQISSIFSRCRRPSLSSKRPLRACQLPRHACSPAASTRIPTLPAPSTKFLQTFTVSSP